MRERIERLQRLGGTADRRRVLDVMARHATALDRLAALLDAVCRGQALGETWRGYKDLRAMREDLDRVVTEMETIAAALLPTASDAVN